MKIKKVFSTALLAMVSFVMVLSSGCGSRQVDSENLVQYIGTKAPGFQLEDLNGQMIDSERYEGKTLVIHIATTWCPYCNAEAPYLQLIAEEYKDLDVGVLIIDVKEEKSLVTKLLKEKFNLTFPILLDTDGVVAASFAPADILSELARDEVMLASNILIDKSGKIQFFSLLNTAEFDSQLTELKSILNEIL